MRSARVVRSSTQNVVGERFEIVTVGLLGPQEIGVGKAGVKPRDKAGERGDFIIAGADVLFAHRDCLVEVAYLGVDPGRASARNRF